MDNVYDLRNPPIHECRSAQRYFHDPAEVLAQDAPSETFRVLKNKELREFGEYRQRRLVLAAWYAMAEAGQ